MNILQEHLQTLTTEQLQQERVEIEQRIEQDDGRLTPHSSADLDYLLDLRDDIDTELKRRTT